MQVSEGDIGSDRPITNSTSKEADAGVVRHVKDAVSGFSPITVRTIDTECPCRTDLIRLKCSK